MHMFNCLIKFVHVDLLKYAIENFEAIYDAVGSVSCLKCKGHISVLYNLLFQNQPGQLAKVTMIHV